jgi:hypothetical protein
MTSERQWESVRELRRFREELETAEREKQDRAEYEKYTATLQAENARVGPALQVTPLAFEEWRAFAPKEINDPALRGTLATANSLHKRDFESDREHVVNGRDPKLYVSPELAGARMTEQQARAFNSNAADAFMAKTPDFYKCPQNRDALLSYLDRNSIGIANEQMFSKAFERLRSFGLILERPEMPEPEPLSEPEPAPTDDGSMVGIDPLNGVERRYTKREIDLMPSDLFKLCFALKPIQFVQPIDLIQGAGA